MYCYCGTEISELNDSLDNVAFEVEALSHLVSEKLVSKKEIADLLKQIVWEVKRANTMEGRGIEYSSDEMCCLLEKRRGEKVK